MAESTLERCTFWLIGSTLITGQEKEVEDIDERCVVILNFKIR